MRTVPLSGALAAGRVALVDDEDYGLVAAYRWHVWERKRPGRRTWGPYTQAELERDGARAVIYMHKLITGWPRTDHINHDGLDNQRHNLRPVTVAQNTANQRPHAQGSSPYKGVCWHRANRVWQATVKVNSKTRYLGCFDCEEDAARAYDAAALAAFGSYAYLNFGRVA